jgi:hypothetical protein
MSHLASASTIGSSVSEALYEIADLCVAGSAGRRTLDARIALVMFPGLADLRQIGIAVWQHPDGSRVRALRYSDRQSAATTLVPTGCWIEMDREVDYCVSVYGPRPQEVVSARHISEPLAIAAACLRVHARMETAESAVAGKSKIGVMPTSIDSPSF